VDLVGHMEPLKLLMIDYVFKPKVNSKNYFQLQTQLLVVMVELAIAMVVMEDKLVTNLIFMLIFLKYILI
jgi:hypothetical protein